MKKEHALAELSEIFPDYRVPGGVLKPVLKGHPHVRPRIAVRHREYVEAVHLLLVVLEVGEPVLQHLLEMDSVDSAYTHLI